MTRRRNALFLHLGILVFCMMLPYLAQAQAPANSPTRQQWVTDQADIIGSQTAQRLTSNAKKHEDNTGDQFVTITVNSLEGMSVERYANLLANDWGIGEHGKDNGVLLLVAPNEREVRIEVGNELANTLTNSIANNIIEYDMLPLFKANRYEDAIIKGHQSILEVLGGNYRKTNWKDFLLLILAAPLIFVRRFLGGNFKGGGGRFSGRNGASGRW